MPKQRNKDRHVSGTGRSDSDKRGGGGNFAWGKPGDEEAPASMDTADPNNAGGAFQARIEARAGDYFAKKDISSSLFVAGVTAGLRSKEQELVTGLFAANGVGDSTAVDTGSDDSTDDFASFCAGVPSKNRFAELESFLTTRSINTEQVGCVILARESEDVPVTLLREGALVTGSAVIDAGVLTVTELKHVVKSYNGKPWTTKDEFDAIVASAPADKPVTSYTENPMHHEDAGESEAPASKSTPMSELSPEYVVYNNDPCLGKAAPDLSSLEVMHWPDGTAENDLAYSGAAATVVCFWSKIHKGNYPTINLWSDICGRFASKGVRFIGVARDTDPAQVGKYIKRIGDHAPTLGENGIWLSGGIPLAYDAGSQVNMGFKTAAQMKTLGVDNAFIVNKEGTIVWRAKFNRGKEPTGVFESQLSLVASGKDVELKNEPPAESSGEDEPEEDTGADKEALKGLMAADY